MGRDQPANQPPKSTAGSPTGDQLEATQPDEAAAPPTALSSAIGRDFESMDVCEIFPAELIASAVGGSVGKEAQPTDLGSSYPACWYWLVLSGSNSDVGDVYILYLESPEIFGYSYSGMEDPRDLNGIGDQAAIDYRADAEDFDLAAVLKGDIAIEVIGEDQDTVTKLAEYVMANLQ